MPENLAQVITKPNGAKEYRVSDHLASLRVAIEGATTRTMDYDPWGNVIAGSLTGERSTFNDQERDIETGLFDVSDRNYDPATGRFWKPDRLLESFPWVSPYGYCNANPLRLTDPTGMQTVEASEENTPDEDDDDGTEPAKQDEPKPTKARRQTVDTEGNAVDSDDPEPDPVPLSEPDQAKAVADYNQAHPDEGMERHSGPEEDTKGGVYVLKDPKTGEVVYVGHSNDLDRRGKEHKKNPEKKPYDFEPVHKTDDKAARRGLEQLEYEKFNPPLNKVRPISPKNPRRDAYIRAALEVLRNLYGDK